MNPVNRVKPSGWRWALLACVLGAVQAWAFTPWVAAYADWAPAVVEAVAVGAFVGLLHRTPRPKIAAWTGWGFGLGWLTGGTLWLYVSLHQFGGLPSWLAVASVVLLAAALSLYLALACACWAQWRRRHWVADAALFGALWVLAEVARALIFTGFPWAASGYALVDSPLAVLAPWLGVYGMGQVMASGVAAVVLAFSLGQGRLLALVVVGGAVLVLSVLPGRMNFVRPHGRPLSVTLIQGNVPQNEKFEATFQIAMMGWHAEQLLAATGDLVVAPETVIPLLPADLPEGYWARLTKHFQHGSTAALIGVPLGSFKAGYTNSVAGISKTTLGEPGGFYRYNKYHLVPFGEFVPMGFHWFVQMMNIPLGDFTRGPVNAPSFEVAGQWIAPNICYEDLFGEDLAARFVSGRTPAPTILANVSNLAWFGEEVAIYQHLQIARLRSMEFQRPTIRATNTGATVVIDQGGRVVASQPPHTRGALVTQVQGTTGLTPFARWAGAWGLWPLILLALAMTWLLRARRPGP